MAKPPVSPGRPRLSHEDAIKKLTAVRGEGLDLQKRSQLMLDGHDLEEWTTKACMIVEGAFGKDADAVHEFRHAGPNQITDREASESVQSKVRLSELGAKMTKLAALISGLQMLGPSDDESGEVASGTKPPRSKRVFIVHGHDDAALHETARFVQSLGLDPVILREQVNQGRTIIEKFEDYGDVAFAIVLLTPDDQGAKKGIPFDQQQGRARQNVIFEHGFFMGKLGRDHVCALHKSGTEIITDFAGVLYISLDDGSWKYKLAKELRVVFPFVDMNKV